MIKIILCALNEAQNLETLLPNINREMQKIDRDYEIIICLDASNDNSEKIILAQKNSYPIRILDFLAQKGLGNAYKRVFLEIIKTANPNDIAISLDADNTHNPNQITQIISYFEKNSLDILIVSRFCKDSKINGFPLYRFFISKTTSILLQFFFNIKKISGRKVKDYSSGYRAYKIKKLQELYKKYGENFILEKNFIYTCEILLKMSKIDAKIDEIALNYDYGRKIGKSKLKIIQNLWSLLKLIVRNTYTISH